VGMFFPNLFAKITILYVIFVLSKIGRLVKSV